jgi:hypothetical protein
VGVRGGRKVGDGTRGIGDAMGGEEDGASIGDHKRPGSSKGGGAEAKATEFSRELEERLGVGWQGRTGKLFEKLEGRSIDGGGEGRGPEKGVSRDGGRGSGIEVRGKEMGNRVLGGVVEELGTGLGIGKATVEGKGSVLEGRELVVEKGLGKGGTADGLAEGASTSGEFGRGSEDGKSLLAEKLVRRRQVRWGAGGGSEDLRLGEAKADAVGEAKAVELGDIERKVTIA